MYSTPNGSLGELEKFPDLDEEALPEIVIESSPIPPKPSETPDAGMRSLNHCMSLKRRLSASVAQDSLHSLISSNVLVCR